MQFHSLTQARWQDFESLFGSRGACGGCWCMWWRLPRAVFEKQKYDLNKQAMHGLVKSGEIPGILGYVDKRPVGWCSIAPREHFPALARSRILKPVDDQPVWSVVCFFVARGYRRQGVTVQLLRAAVTYARANGAGIVEGYPVEPRKPAMPDVFAYTGLSSAFREAGFTEVARRSETRPIMRLTIEA